MPGSEALQPSTDLAALLRGCVAEPDQLRLGELDRRALAHDASHFLLLPAAVVAPRDAEEVGRLLRATAAAGIGLTFRSGGHEAAFVFAINVGGAMRIEPIEVMSFDRDGQITAMKAYWSQDNVTML